MEFGEEFGLQATQAYKSFHSYLYKLLEESDLQNHYQIILILTRYNGKATQKLLCEQLNIEKSNMAVMIDALEAKGYARREVNHKDRRGKLVVLTPKAEQVLSRLETVFQHFEKNVLKDISWQEMYNCLRIMKKINSNLADMNTFIPLKPKNSTGMFLNKQV
ncbi:winged helix DNA-binding protein [Mucilaginibacter sp. RS28]|uniref:Winged helix DNA-binding protein n=1 Tax=Mucilaginibacter straminoryzae TaxID=2932774 RepID=A0A9X1X639_9SPHI|nr:MarR family transcriptional regulator [Mucilaginibacter straminoryzae]MCJ8211807.1 winged helix DNA-binding protein [Mucilaginibacter straminoryzae]